VNGFLKIFPFILSFALSACFGSASREKAEPEEIYFDYRITGEEGNDSVSVMLKFREFDEHGPAVSVETGSVLLDGKAVSADSTPMTGPFYLVIKPLQEFTGKHTITVTLPGKKKFNEEFYFRPFSIRSGISDTMGRDKIVLDLEGLDKKDYVRVLMMDTSFTGDGINRLDTVWNNKLMLSKYSLSYLESGPIHLELIRETEKLVENHTGAGGTITVLYTIRREFWLRD